MHQIIFKFSILLFLSITFIFISSCNLVLAENLPFELCPLCTNNGEITCPGGYEVACVNEIPGDTEPRCLLFGSMFIPGCWKYVGIMSIDFSILPESLPKGATFKVIGGGEVYTLNREIIGCKQKEKLEVRY